MIVNFHCHILPLVTIVVEKWKGWNLHPAFAIRYRYRNAGGGAGNITIRAPCSAVGHGSMYHSQSVSNSATNMFGSRMGWPPWPFWWAKSWKMLIQHDTAWNWWALYTVVFQGYPSLRRTHMFLLPCCNLVLIVLPRKTFVADLGGVLLCPLPRAEDHYPSRAKASQRFTACGNSRSRSSVLD